MIPLSTPLRGLPFAAIDFEATGFAGPDAHVVEIGVAHGTFGGGDVRLAFSSRVRPPVSIPEAASKVHGITDADVVDAPTFAEVWPRLAAAIEGRLLVAYNVPADRAFLGTELGRMALPTPEPWLCALVVRRATKTRGRPGRLGEVAEEYGIALDAHGAAGDALTLGLLLRPLLRRAAESGAVYAVGYGRPPATLGELLDWQRVTALYQERDWADYRRRQGDARPPESPWHRIFGEEPPTWAAPLRTTSCPSCGAAVRMRVRQDGGLAYVAPDGAEHTCTEAGHP